MDVLMTLFTLFNIKVRNNMEREVVKIKKKVVIENR